MIQSRPQSGAGTTTQRGLATRLVVNRAKIEEVARQRGVSSIRHLHEYAQERGFILAQGTVYKIVQGGNFQKESLETLARVLDLPLHEFVQFKPHMEEW